jgi:Kef-type K+ transport system membrane component KefB
MIDIDSVSFLFVVLAGAVAAFVAGLVSTRMPLPVVVLEVLLGILIGPDVLGLADSDAFLNFFSNLGLGMLFFFAGYEIDFERIRGSPLRLGVIGWLISLVLAYSLGGLLALSGVVLSLLFTGSAMATTAIGTLIPVLSDAGEMRTRFGTYLLAAGAVGEFGPILLITLVFSTKGAPENAVILAAFVVVAVAAALMAVRGVGRGWGLLDRSLATSGQFAVRIAVLMVFALGALADSLGLDLLLGGFVAGVIARVALQGHEVEVLESKLTAVGYGFLIPFFFVVSGVNFDLTALTSHPIHLLELPLFLALFLIVRGTPAMVLYRGVLGFRDRAALAVFSATALPLIVAITTIAVTEGHMRSSTAAALVGAGILSTAIFPVIGLRLRAGTPKDAPTMAAEPPPTPHTLRVT